jgi:enolase-phosphatase E1
VQVDRRVLDAVVLDIEGTTTPIAFVYEVLFPFARRHVRELLRERRGSPALADAMVRLQLEWADDVARGEAPPPWSDASDVDLSLVAAYIEWLMDRDRKSPGLKLIQGFVWERGYLSGELKSEVFADVRPAIERWRGLGLAVTIYSSGSELAQRLLFGHTPEGDLTPYFTGFFDTAVGAKTSPESYLRIAAVIRCASDRILFVSDAAGELDAAHEAGCRTAMCVRPGNPVQSPAAPVDVIRSFDEIIVN